MSDHQPWCRAGGPVKSAMLNLDQSSRRTPDLPASFMVGRTSERVLLREQLAAMEAGRGQLVILGGEAGIGKTTLARDLIATAEKRGHRVLVGRCFDLTAASPYGIWFDLATDYQRTGGPEGPPVLPPVLVDRNLDGITSQSGFFELVRAFLHDLAARQPTLIVLEDVHWADPASLELLRHIASQLSFARLLLGDLPGR
jgi:predicted ATPase